MARVVLAMSGGVDSSVAAHLLREQGHEVVGVFMRHGQAAAPDSASGPMIAASLPLLQNPSADHQQGCCSAADAQDARRVADCLDIPFYALDLQADFARIIDYFVAEYSAGRTPNPCIVCNTWLKFGRLFDYADSIGASFVATGHYARLIHAPSGLRLGRGLDLDKDQSYVLFGIGRSLLSRMLLPLGLYHKGEIRRRAAELGLRVAAKRDSQEICFVAPGQHGRFVRRHRGNPDTTGEIVTSDGRVVGQHEGIENFTVGQRRGLGVALGEPHFVVRICAQTRRVVLGRRDELARRRLTACRSNWLTDPPCAPFHCLVQIRYRSPATPACVTVVDRDRFEVEFDEPCYGVAPGQAAVCFDGDFVWGGGWIE